MCVYLTYVLSTHTTYAALKATGVCAFPNPGVRDTRRAERGDAPACASLPTRPNVASLPSLSFQPGSLPCTAPARHHQPPKMRVGWWHPAVLPRVLRAWAFGGEDKACEDCKAHLAQRGLMQWDVPGSQCFSVTHSLVCVS